MIVSYMITITFAKSKHIIHIFHILTIYFVVPQKCIFRYAKSNSSTVSHVIKMFTFRNKIMTSIQNSSIHSIHNVLQMLCFIHHLTIYLFFFFFFNFRFNRFNMSMLISFLLNSRFKVWVENGQRSKSFFFLHYVQIHSIVVICSEKLLKDS